ncbi:GNAT family N-acetyltransferase [Flavobacterium soyangense]|uniref:GNAT family N-acetyltransferase n=1 Tax=Flavobacterium soyangense TaxID=2023265 RepID=A0A930UDV2_9FLAO|nr:GNAT family N-acetyltransferase [Flavobacterium soyangense]MBF2708944.1 GNAT family N-acetyltransferase [Flavobacterium soyangense]
MLEKVKADDFSYIYKLYMNPEVNPFLLYEMMDSETFRPIFDDLLKDEVLYLYKEGTKTLGMCKLVRQKYRDEHKLYLGGVAIHPEHFGKGFGRKMMLEIIDFCREKAILRIELTAAVHNKKAIQLYENVGFIKEGVLKNYTYLKSKNQFIDEVLMSNLL